MTEVMIYVAKLIDRCQFWRISKQTSKNHGKPFDLSRPFMLSQSESRKWTNLLLCAHILQRQKEITKNAALSTLFRPSGQYDNNFVIVSSIRQNLLTFVYSHWHRHSAFRHQLWLLYSLWWLFRILFSLFFFFCSSSSFRPFLDIGVTLFHSHWPNWTIDSQQLATIAPIIYTLVQNKDSRTFAKWWWWWWR